MKTLNHIRRSLVNYVALLTILAVMSLMVGLSSQSVLDVVNTLEPSTRLLEAATR